MNHKLIKNHKGSSLLSPAHGRVGARATILSFLPLSAPPPPEKIAEGFQQAGKKWSEAESRTELALVREKGKKTGRPQHQSKAWCWLKIFARLFRSAGAMGWEAFPPSRSWRDIKAKQFSIPFKKNLAGGR